MAGIETGNVQGLVASAYGHMPHSAYLLLGVTEPAAARRWLGSIVADVTTGAGKQEDRPCLNVAFTWAGLGALGLGEDALRSFPRAVQEGLATGYRSRILGDTGDSAPSRWRWGGPHTGEVHVLLMVFARTEGALRTECELRRAAFTAGGALQEVAEPVLGRVLDGGREHFGFADGISQPVMRGCGNEPGGPAARWAVVEPGEFVLGYRDNYGRPAEGPSVARSSDGTAVLPPLPGTGQRSDLGRNGSYVVLRQLAQDVPAFHRFVAQAAGGDEADPERRQRVAAELVGRWPSGAPLVLAPEHDDAELHQNNDFGYHDVDQDGIRCPLGAHIRRANPRDSSRNHPAEALRSGNNHRLLRRGRPYGLPIADPPRSAGEE
ncbi:MAG: Dyp-type peroxidase, partial [Acidimicrobiia bacterium]